MGKAGKAICGLLILLNGTSIANGETIYDNEALVRMYMNPMIYQSQAIPLIAPTPVIQYGP